MHPRLTDHTHHDQRHEILSTITSKGQVTLPKAVRDHLGVATHDRVSFVIAEDGTITLQVPRFPSIASLAGIARTLPRPLSWHEMRQIAREDAVHPAEHPQGARSSRNTKPDKTPSSH